MSLFRIAMIVLLLGCSGIKKFKLVDVEDSFLKLFFETGVDQMYEQSKEDGNTSLYSSMVNPRRLIFELTLNPIR